LGAFRAATIVPSSACDGDVCGFSAVPSVVTWYWPLPSGFESQTLLSRTNTIESALAAAGSAASASPAASAARTMWGLEVMPAILRTRVDPAIGDTPRRSPIGSRPMLLLALSEAAKTTITFVALWFVGFPAIVTGLIAFAVVQALGEARENRERWTFRRR
jgi:hypothetical protein